MNPYQSPSENGRLQPGEHEPSGVHAVTTSPQTGRQFVPLVEPLGARLWALRRTGWLATLSAMEARVLSALAISADFQNAQTADSSSSVADDLDMNRRNVERAIESLTKKGILLKVRTRGQYQIREIVCPPNPPNDREGNSNRPTSGAVGRPPTATLPAQPLAQLPAQPPAQLPAPLPAQPPAQENRTPISQTPSTTNHEISTNTDVDLEQVTPELIYDAYPRKVARAKALQAIAAAQRRLKAKGQPPDGYVTWEDWLLERTKAYADVRRAEVAIRPEAEQFTPHPSTFFAQSRFEDDPSTWAPTKRNNGDSNGKEHRRPFTRPGEYAEPAIAIPILEPG